MGKDDAGELEPLARVFGAHNLKFSSESWSVLLEESREKDGNARNQLFLKGTFSNWDLWQKVATCRVRPEELANPPSDVEGRPVLGLVQWQEGFSLTDGKLEGFDNGSIEVGFITSSDLFEKILFLLREKTRLSVDFTLSGRPPKSWDGTKPLTITGASFFFTSPPVHG